MVAGAGIIAASLTIISLFGLYSAIRPFRITSNVTPATFGLNYEEITLTTEDSIRLAAWFIPNNKPDKTIIALHGYPADKGNILPALTFLTDHYNLLLFDFRYHGESEGSHTTIGALETKDLAAATAFLKERGISEIGIWGFSLGGAVALMEAGKHPEVKAVVSESSYANLYQTAPALYPLPGLRAPLAALTRLWGILVLGIDVKNVSPERAAGALHIPILIIHSQNDRVIPFKHALALQEALHNNSKAEFWFKEYVSHGQLGNEYQQHIVAFFQKHL